MTKICNSRLSFIYLKIGVVMNPSTVLTIVWKDSAFHPDATKYSFADTGVHTVVSKLSRRKIYLIKVSTEVSHMIYLVTEVKAKSDLGVLSIVSVSSSTLSSVGSRLDLCLMKVYIV